MMVDATAQLRGCDDACIVHGYAAACITGSRPSVCRLALRVEVIRGQGGTHQSSDGHARGVMELLPSRTFARNLSGSGLLRQGHRGSSAAARFSCMSYVGQFGEGMPWRDMRRGRSVCGYIPKHDYFSTQCFE